MVKYSGLAAGLVAMVTLCSCGGGLSPTGTGPAPTGELPAGSHRASTPSISAVSPAAGAVLGVAAGSNPVALSVSGAQDVTRVEYRLDLVPLGSDGPEDLKVESTAGGDFVAQFDISALSNQSAALVVKYFNAANESGSLTSNALWVFNQRGDINGDGFVSKADLTALVPLIGKASADPGFVPYADSDGDGTITEADGAAVGYNYGARAVLPQINDITPFAGNAGATLQFTANVVGSGPLAYAWDFGGGATPNSSADAAPAVTLGATGIYTVQLAVSSEFGSDEFSFELTVLPNSGTPHIDDVFPFTGISGTSVQFTANVTGTAPLTYAWDFGGGATPGTSADATPTVTLGAPGAYTVQLTLSNALGSDVFTFTLPVDPRPGPVALLSLDPAAGMAPLEIHFDASASNSVGGTINLYEWSWDGDDVYEESSASPQATHTFIAIGSYNVKLRVTDDQGLTAYSVHTIEVLDPIATPGWGQVYLGPFGKGSTGENLQLAAGEVAGKPALIWSRDDQDTTNDTVYVTRALAEKPETAADWAVEPVFAAAHLRDCLGICDIDGEAGFSYGVNHEIYYGRYHGDSFTAHLAVSNYDFNIDDAALANIAGKPAFVFRSYGGSTGSNMAYAYAGTADPQSAADWTVLPVDLPRLSAPTSFAHQLLDVGGRPMYQNLATGGRLVCYATSATPGSNDWGSYLFAGGGPYSRMYDDGGLPAIIVPVSGQRCYARASTLQPTLASDWVTHVPEATNWGLQAGGDIDGRPVFTYANGSSLHMVLANTDTPTSAADWTVSLIPPELEDNRRFVSHGGKVGVFSTISGAGGYHVVYRFQTP